MTQSRCISDRAAQKGNGASPPGGYHGQYLHVDVTTGQHRTGALDEPILRRFLGGCGLGTHLLLRHRGYASAPLGPAAPLVFAFSPLVGSPVTTTAKFSVVSRSPLTERINDALSSSGFALAGKRTGFDAIVITGRAAEPSVLVIDDGQVRVEPAGDAWGQSTSAAEKLLKERLASDFQIATIGPAGEMQVRFATISHDGRHAGRGGSGAVLGAKNLKAIAVRGRRTCRWANSERLLELAGELSKRSLGPATAKYRELGTVSNLLLFNRLHTLPTRNFQAASFSGAAALAPENFAPQDTRVRDHCAGCTIGCEHIFSLPEDRNGDAPPVRLEYESLFALGPLCGIDRPQAVLQAARLCDELGLDTISAGGTIAFAMECVERGLLDAPWLRFGQPAALDRALHEIARREGSGELLAEGSRRLAAQIGPPATGLAPHVKGLELPGYEPRTMQTLALGLAVAARGADHNRSGAYEADFSAGADRQRLSPQSAAAAIASEDRAAVMDSLIICKFLRGVFNDFYGEAAELLAAVTGWDVSADELRAAARRIICARKLFNIRAGWQPSEDTLPARFFDDPLAEDATARLSREALAAAVAEYYRLRGWDESGGIPAEQLAVLQLEVPRDATAGR